VQKIPFQTKKIKIKLKLDHLLLLRIIVLKDFTVFRINRYKMLLVLKGIIQNKTVLVPIYFKVDSKGLIKDNFQIHQINWLILKNINLSTNFKV
jgi:hypothetical protein